MKKAFTELYFTKMAKNNLLLLIQIFLAKQTVIVPAFRKLIIMSCGFFFLKKLGRNFMDPMKELMEDMLTLL